METTVSLLPKIIEQTGLSESKAGIITERFANYEEKAAEWSELAKGLIVTDENDRAKMKMARDGRLFLRQLRLNVEATRKELKEEYLQGGRAVDHVAKHLVSLIAPTEDYLQEQETFALRAATARKEALRVRRHEALQTYTADPNIYSLTELSEEAFSELLNGFVLAKQAREEAAQQAEIARVAALAAETERLAAEVKAREAQRIENEQLRKEAAEREAALAAERAENTRKQREAAEKAATEKAAADAELQKERAATEVLRHAAAEKVAAEKATAERAVAEAAATERKRVATEKKAAAAPDREKLTALIAAIEALSLPTLATVEAQEIISNVRGLLSKVTGYITTKAEAL